MSNYEIAKMAIENFEDDYGLPTQTRFSYDDVIAIVKEALRIQNDQIKTIMQNCL